MKFEEYYKELYTGDNDMFKQHIQNAWKAAQQEPVIIGDYEISNHELGIAIYHEDPEGGIFDKDDFLKVVDKFYKENF